MKVVVDRTHWNCKLVSFCVFLRASNKYRKLIDSLNKLVLVTNKVFNGVTNKPKRLEKWFFIKILRIGDQWKESGTAFRLVHHKLDGRPNGNMLEWSRLRFIRWRTSSNSQTSFTYIQVSGILILLSWKYQINEPISMIIQSISKTISNCSNNRTGSKIDKSFEFAYQFKFFLFRKSKWYSMFSSAKQWHNHRWLCYRMAYIIWLYIIKQTAKLTNNNLHYGLFQLYTIFVAVLAIQTNWSLYSAMASIPKVERQSCTLSHRWPHRWTFVQFASALCCSHIPPHIR